MRERGVHRKATFEDRFYRHWCCGKYNHPEGWAKDKHMNRKALRRWLKNEQRREERDN